MYIFSTLSTNRNNFDAIFCSVVVSLFTCLGSQSHNTIRIVWYTLGEKKARYTVKGSVYHLRRALNVMVHCAKMGEIEIRCCTWKIHLQNPFKSYSHFGIIHWMGTKLHSSKLMVDFFLFTGDVEL